jgi:RNA polymerase-associated protein LEO1
MSEGQAPLLPVAAQSQDSQAETQTVETQAEETQPAETRAAETQAAPLDLDDVDLFGEPDEPARPPQEADDLDERELFGDDAVDVDEKELFGSDDEDAKNDERELFGSDDDAEQPNPQPLERAAPELSEMDEAEIFGAMSDEEPERVEDVVLKTRPRPDEGRVFVTVRLPNVLSAEKTAFNGRNFSQAVRQGYTEQLDTQNKQTAKLLNPENCIRWRFIKDSDGQQQRDEEGRPQYASNSRRVEWEDGSRTLFVGNEAFSVSELNERLVIFEENSQDIHVCHGFVNKRLVVTPTSLASSTHEMLKSAQYNKYEPTRRSLLFSPEEMEEQKQMGELEAEQKRRQAQKRPHDPAGAGETEITAAFLEDDVAGEDGGIGPSALAIKHDHKRRRG